FNLVITVTYPAVPSNYEIIGLKDEAVILFDTSRDAQVTIYYGTTPGTLNNMLPIVGFRTSHNIALSSLSPLTKYYFKIVTINLDGEKYVDNNAGSLYSFETIDDLPIYTTVTKNLGIEELYFKELSGGVSFVNFSIGLFAGLSVPLLFTQKTPKYLIPGNEISSSVTVEPGEGFMGAKAIGEVSVYGYKLQMFEPISYFYNFTTPFGDLTLYTGEFSYVLGSLNKSESIYNIDLTASMDVQYQLGIYLETNVSMGYSGPVTDGSTANYIIDEGQETKVHSDTVSPSATDKSEVVCDTNVTLQFNNLYFRITSINLSVVGSVNTTVASDPSVNINYEVVGDGALFSPITFPVLNGLLFPITIKEEYLRTTSIVDRSDPVVKSIVDSKVSDTEYVLEASTTDNLAVWDVLASVEIDGGAPQTFLMSHTSGSLYEVILNIPQGSTAEITIVVRDVAGRIVQSTVYVISNPAIAEFGQDNLFILFSIIPIAIIPMYLKYRKKKL
ncbi:MAG: hypothetical protein ACTSX6_12485, partial [Candidatus Heimdallarchaeaceae archaeon]